MLADFGGSEDSMQRRGLQITIVHGKDERPAAIRMPEDAMAAGLMVKVESGALQRLQHYFGFLRPQALFQTSSTSTVTVSVEGTGSPCFCKQAR